MDGSSALSPNSSLRNLTEHGGIAEEDIAGVLLSATGWSVKCFGGLTEENAVVVSCWAAGWEIVTVTTPEVCHRFPSLVLAAALRPVAGTCAFSFSSRNRDLTM
jgi:hypothetical protein